MLELAGVTHRHVEARGMRFHVAEAGPDGAPPVFLTHGWPQHWWLWRHVIPQLATDRKVYAWDLRGLGWSDAAPDGDYTKTAMADDLLGVMDALNVDRAGLVGHDWGAFSGMIACVKAPERFTGFVSCSVPHLWPRDRFNPRRLVLLGYQGPITTPLLGERLMRQGFARRLLKAGRASGRWSDEELHAFGDVMREPKAAKATVGIYRQFLTKELPGFLRASMPISGSRCPRGCSRHRGRGGQGRLAGGRERGRAHGALGRRRRAFPARRGAGGRRAAARELL